MTQIRIEYIYNGSFPVDVYISDIYGNNSSLLGTIDPGPVPPQVQYNVNIPPIFNTAPQVMLTLIDNNGCENFKILDCVFGCSFELIITPNFVFL
jgi:hypothetical protein